MVCFRLNCLRLLCYGTAWLWMAGAALGQNGSIAGHVTNSVTGEAVTGATVRLMPLTTRMSGDLPAATSQGDGSYHFDSLSPGRYMVLAERDAFVDGSLGRNSLIVEVAAGQLVPDLQVTLIPDGGVSGKVTDQDGTPMAGVQVQAFFVLGQGRNSRLQASGSIATTDKAGRFALANLDPGNYFVLAVPDQSATKPRPDGYALVDTFYPQGVSMQEASPLTVTAGQATEAPVKLRTALTYRVQGKIAELPPGTGSRDLRLEVAPSGGVNLRSLSRSVQVSDDLAFVVSGIVSGHYELLLTTGGLNRRNARHLLARQEIEVGSSDLSGLVLRPSPPITLTGTVSLQTSNAPLTGISVRAVPVEDANRGSIASAFVGADGTFTLNNLEPAPYMIAVQPNHQGTYVASLTLNQRDILNQAVDLSDSTGSQVAALIKTGTGQISGTVTETGSVVVLVPQRIAPDASNVRISYTQPNGGTFVLPNIAPGDYLLYAGDRNNTAVWLSVLFLEAIRNLGQAVHLDEGGSQTVELSRTADTLLREQALRLGLNFQ